MKSGMQGSLSFAGNTAPFAQFPTYLGVDSTVAGAVGGVALVSLLLLWTGVAAVSASTWPLDRGLSVAAPVVPLPEEELRLIVSGERSLL
jgi:hypothetical protein